MASPIRSNIPSGRLARLDFLLGESTGFETLYPPGRHPVLFRACVCGSRESCERFLRVEFYGDIPGIGAETFTIMLTYSETRECYRMWIFAASHEEPLHLVGDFQEERLVMVSDATGTFWGTQRLRYTLTPLRSGGYDLFGELWEPDGYVKYCTARFRPTEHGSTLSPEMGGPGSCN